MKKIYALLLLALSVSGYVFAQIPISTARGSAVGATITVSGIVMNGNELGPIRYFDDGTGGFAAYGAATAPAQRGDSIIVTGVVKLFNNLMELDPITSLQIVSRRNPIHPPIRFTSANWNVAFAEVYEGRLVQMVKVPTITTSTGGSIGGSFAGNTNYRLNNNPGLIARTNNASSGGDTGIVGKPAPTDTFSVVGVMSQFSSVSPTSGYQLLPRLYADFISGPAPTIISTIDQTNVTQTSITLAFTTQNLGNTIIEYGPTPAFGSLLTDLAQTRDHSITLPNLLPGKIYYVKVSSANGNGTSIANVVTFVTESQSTGKMKAYFTRSVRTLEALPGNAAVYLPSAVDDTLISYIDRAQESLDIAIYNWNNSGLSDITAAVNAAYARGVKVRVISDGTAANLGVNGLNAGIRRVASPTTGTYTIMHNKYVVIDAESTNPNRPWLWTGSTNWTSGMINTDYNNAVAIQDQSLARVFKLEFEEMWGSDSLRPGTLFNGTTGTARFGAFKQDNTPHAIKVGGKMVNAYFSPSDNVQARIIETINSANTSFQVGINVWTRNEIGFALRDTYNRIGAGNCSRLITDDTSGQGEGTCFAIAATAMRSNAQTYTPAGIFHHKYVIVDQDNAASDPLVLTGSHNWSAAANTNNDENTLIIHDQMIANQFFQEFSARWENDGNTNCLVTSVKPIVSSTISLAPNPANETLQVSLPRSVGRNIRVLTIDGKVVLSKKASADETTINIQALAPGAYLIQIEGVAVPARFIKQ